MKDDLGTYTGFLSELLGTVLPDISETDGQSHIEYELSPEGTLKRLRMYLDRRAKENRIEACFQVAHEMRHVYQVLEIERSRAGQNELSSFEIVLLENERERREEKEDGLTETDANGFAYLVLTEVFGIIPRFEHDRYTENYLQRARMLKEVYYPRNRIDRALLKSGFDGREIRQEFIRRVQGKE